MPPEAAELFLMKGTCQVELKEYSLAHNSFNEVIKIDAKYAEVNDNDKGNTFIEHKYSLQMRVIMLII